MKTIEQGGPEIPIETPDNLEVSRRVEIIELPEAKFRLIYELHGFDQSLSDLGNPDALILEKGLPEGFFDFSEQEMSEYLMSHLQINSGSFAQAMAEKGKPIFYCDISFEKVKAKLIQALQTIEMAAGITLLLGLAADVTSDEPLTRREFFKRSAKGVAGTYLAIDIPIILAALVGGKPGRAVQNTLGIANNRIHPETKAIIHTLRDNIVAQKAFAVAQEVATLGTVPEVAIKYGRGHVGIKRALEKSEEERLKIIKQFLDHLLLTEHAEDNLMTIVRFDYDESEGRWKATVLKDSKITSLHDTSK